MLHVQSEQLGLCRVSGSRYNATLRFALPDAWNHMCTDHLGRFLLSCECASQAFDLAGDIGHPRQLPGGADTSHTYKGYPPVGVSRGRIAGLNSWSTYLMNVKAVFTDWSFANGNLSFHERPVSHYNLRGRLTEDVRPIDFYRQGSPFYTAGEYNYQRYAGTYTDGDGITFYGSPTYNIVGGLWNILPVLPSVYYMDFDSDSIHYSYSHVDYGRDGVYVDHVSYKVVVEQWSGGRFHRKTIRVRLDFWVERSPRYVPSNTGFSLSSVCPMFCRYQTCVTAEAHGIDPSSSEGLIESSYPVLTTDWANYPSYGLTEVVLDTYATHPHTIPGNPDGLVGFSAGVYEHTHSNCFRAFRQTTLPILQDCYSACFISTSNAVDAHLEKMKSNHLEALLEVGDFVKLVDLVVALKCLRSRRHLFKSLLSLLADAKLTYSFGIAPTISDAKDVAGRAQAFMHKYTTGDLYRWHTVHGVFKMDLPDSFRGEFLGMRLVARSRVTVAVNPDSYLATLLPVDAVGLLPTFSAIWDVIPFSFLVDWLLPVGDYLNDLDHQLMFLALEQQPSIHSIALEFNFPDDLLGAYGLKRTGEEFSGYRYYDRFALAGLPTLGPTRLPIHGLARIPDWGTAGSLLYKFFS